MRGGAVPRVGQCVSREGLDRRAPAIGNGRARHRRDARAAHGEAFGVAIVLAQQQADAPGRGRHRRQRLRCGRCLGQRSRRRRQTRRGKPPASVARDIIAGGKVRLARRLQPGDPAPRQRVRRRVAVEQLPVEQVRPQLPRQPQREDPDAGKPHPRVVVEIAVRREFGDPCVEAIDAGVARERAVIGRPPAAGLHLQPGKVGAVAGPHRRAHFEPTLPIGSPQHFLEKLLRRRSRMLTPDRRDDLGFGDKAVAQVA